MRYLKIVFKKIKNKFRATIYAGNNVVCDICGWKGDRFFDQKCPRCNSLPRTRLIPYAVKHFNLLNKDVKIIHVSPNVHEFNYVNKHVENIANYDRLDIREEIKYTNLTQDLTNTDLENSTYDLAIAWHVLEHIPEDEKAISEVYRILKSGGKFLVSVPIYPLNNHKTFEDKAIPYKDFEKVHGHYDHCRSCGLDYYERFEKVGFKTETLEIKSVSIHDIKRYGLRKDHLVWSFTK